MSAELSRRVAKIIDVMVQNGLQLEERYKLAGMVDKVKKFEDLPLIYKIKIIDAEKLIA